MKKITGIISILLFVSFCVTAHLPDPVVEPGLNETNKNFSTSNDDPEAVDLMLPVCFRDNMVLQRNKKVAIWGQAGAANKITVRFNGQNKTTIAAEGKWKLYLDPMLANAEEQSLVIEAYHGGTLLKSETINGILVGDVYLASGQSNMFSFLKNYLDKDEEIINNPLIRFYDLPGLREYGAELENGGPESWTKCANESYAMQYSGTAYYFAKNLQPEVDVPIGIIKSAVGATPVEAWMSKETILNIPGMEALLERKFDPKLPDHQQPTILYDQMITPLLPYTLCGVIWYQGESNTGDRIGGGDDYKKLFPAMITQWRSDFENETLPFFYVQLAAFGGFDSTSLVRSNQDEWSILREAQLNTLELENTGMAIAIDLGEQFQIHPKTKKEVGRRLSLLARKQIYNEDIVASGPIYSGYTIEDDKVIISFKHSGTKLALAEGSTELVGFEIASGDENYVEAKAEIVEKTVVVSGVDNPKYVRYAWKNWPEYHSVFANLYNSEGLPASPFRAVIND